MQEVKALKGWVEPFERAQRPRAERAASWPSCSRPSPTRSWSRSRRGRSRRIGGGARGVRAPVDAAGPDDFRDAQLEIIAGAGGTESQDWARDADAHVHALGRAPAASRSRCSTCSQGEEAGIKGAVARDQGRVRLRLPQGGEGRAPAGAHLAVRLAGAAAHLLRVGVRLSGVDDDDRDRDPRRGHQDRRLPRLGRGRAARQQDRSAVRLTHIPTGIVVVLPAGAVAAQEQGDGDEDAARAALYQPKLEEQEAEKAEVEATKTDISCGSQIRSYVFQPYTMVNDHRTELKIADVQKVMDGDIDPFIEAYLKRVRRRGGVSAGVSDELNFVEEARREKLDALEARGHRAVRVPVRAHAHRGRGASPLLPRRDGRRGPGGARSPGRIVAWRGARQDHFAHLADASGPRSSSTSARTSSGTSVRPRSTCSTSATRRRAGAAVPHAHRAKSRVRVERGRRCSPSRSGRCRSGRSEVVDGGDRAALGGFTDPEQRYRQRYADLAVHPEVRDVFAARARMAIARSARSSTGAASSRWRRRCCSRSTAARRRGRSSTHHNALDMPLYLRIADELYLKRLHRGRARARLRDRPRLPERGDRPDAQPRVHDARVLPGVRRLHRHDGRSSRRCSSRVRARRRAAAPRSSATATTSRLRAAVPARRAACDALDASAAGSTLRAARRGDAAQRALERAGVPSVDDR